MMRVPVSKIPEPIKQRLFDMLPSEGDIGYGDAEYDENTSTLYLDVDDWDSGVVDTYSIIISPNELVTLKDSLNTKN